MSEEQSDHTKAAETGAGEVEPELPRGSRIDRYVILEMLGKGSMGVVYKAFDPALNRGVALKLIRAQQDSRGGASHGSARLIREAQALGQLNHPNVVRVHDVGTVGDNVFVAMELVEGRTLRAWCTEAKPATTQVLEVMRAAGRGLEAAHKQGLVHRDFKPENVIVGDDGRVRVIDFGLARIGSTAAPRGSVDLREPIEIDVEIDSTETCRGARGPEGSVHSNGSTLLGSQLTRVGTLLGTPAYMAPEQILGGTLDGRTDQFSYCLVLYELLYGQRPFGGRSLEERIGEVLAGRIRAPPEDTGVPQWLQSIVTRGLAVEPEKRYPSMEELLDRLINNPEEELQKQRRAKKWRTAALSVGAVVVMLSVCLLGLRAYQRAQIRAGCEAEANTIDDVWNREVGERIAQAFAESDVYYAKDTWSRAWPHVDDYVSRWKAARTRVCLQGMLENTRSADLLTRSYSCFNEQRARLRSLVAQWSSPNKTTVQSSGTSAQSFPLLSLCVSETELSRRARLPTDPVTVTAVETLREQLAQAEALTLTGDFNKALSTAQKVLSKALELEIEEIIASARLSLGGAQKDAGRYDEAAETLETAFYGADVAGDELYSLRAASMLVLVVGDKLEQHEEGMKWYELAEGKMGRLAMKPDHPDVATILTYLGVIHRKMANYEQAEKLYQRALSVNEKALGPDHPSVSDLLHNLGVVYEMKGDYKQAEMMYLRVLSNEEAAVGLEHPSLGNTLNNLGIVHANTGDGDKAEKMYQRALSILEKTLGPDHPLVAYPLNNLGGVYRTMGDYDRAEKMYQRALSIWGKSLGPDHPLVSFVLGNRALVYEKKGDYRRAEKMYQGALLIGEKALGPDHPRLTGTLGSLGRIWLARKRFGKAREISHRAVRICGKKRCGAKSHGAALFVLAKVLVASKGNTERAVEFARQAREVYNKTPERFTEELAEVNAWLQKHGVE